MNLAEASRFALGSLMANRMRAGLTMLGMVIGNATIILVVTITLTGRDYILQQIEGLGSNLIYLYYEAGGTVSRSKSLSDDLNLSDLRAIESIPSVTHAAGIVTTQDSLAFDGREREIRVIGTTPGYREIRNLEILSGRFFDGSDERYFNKVCVVTPELSKKLFGTLDIGGESLKLFDVRFHVIGVFREGVETIASEVSTYSALIPLSVMHQFKSSDKLDVIYASARSIAQVPMATERIEQVLDSNHRSGTSYRVENLSEMLAAAERIAQAITIVLFLIGSITLVISGIGIMNIMLVTVTERTKEIGIKKALGARRSEILFQFLTEAVLLACLGGGMGILLGISFPLVGAWASGMDIPVSGISIVLALVVSLGIGVTFGLLPANRAANLDPVEALHYE